MKNIPISELEDDLIIDEDDLEEVCRNQPILYYQVSRQLALCISQRDAAKQTHQEVEAVEDGRIRRNAAKNDEKTTEPQIKLEVKSAKAVVEAMKKFLDLSEKVGQLQALKEAYQQRSYALSHLVDMRVQTFYGESATNRTISNVRDAKALSARKQLSDRRRTEKE